MPEKWPARDQATLARVAAARGPDGVWPDFIDLERGRINRDEARRRWYKSKSAHKVRPYVQISRVRIKVCPTCANFDPDIKGAHFARDTLILTFDPDTPQPF